MLSPKILNSYMYDGKYMYYLLTTDNLSIKDKCFDFVLVPSVLYSEVPLYCYSYPVVSIFTQRS